MEDKEWNAVKYDNIFSSFVYVTMFSQLFILLSIYTRLY